MYNGIGRGRGRGRGRGDHYERLPRQQVGPTQNCEACVDVGGREVGATMMPNGISKEGNIEHPLPGPSRLSMSPRRPRRDAHQRENVETVRSPGSYGRGRGTSFGQPQPNDERNVNQEEFRDWDYNVLPTKYTELVPSTVTNSFANDVQLVNGETANSCEHDLKTAPCAVHPSLTVMRCLKCPTFYCSTDCARKYSKPQHKGSGEVRKGSASSSFSESSSGSDSKTVKSGVLIPNGKSKSEGSPRGKGQKMYPKGGPFSKPKHYSFQEELALAKREREEKPGLAYGIQALEKLAIGDGHDRASPTKENGFLPAKPSRACTNQTSSTGFNGKQAVFETVDLSKEDSFSEYFRVQSINGVNCEDAINKFYEYWPAGIPFKVQVVGIMAPACVLIQTAPLAEKVRKMGIDLISSDRNRPEPAPYNYVAVDHESSFYRAQIEEVCRQSKKCRLRLVDVGKIVVKRFGDLYPLPEELLKYPRQIGTMNIADVKATNLEVWKTFLEDHLIGKIVTVTLTHKLNNLKSHYYGGIVLGNGKALSNLLIEGGLAVPCTTGDDGLTETLLKHDFEAYAGLKLNINESIWGVISHIESPSHFLVTRKPTDESEEIKRAIKTKIKNYVTCETPLVFKTKCSNGSRMCLVHHPDDIGEYCRAYCVSIDYAVDEPQATVILVDHGIIYTTSLDHLMRWNDKQVPNCPPQFYHCKLAAQPTGDHWSDLVVMRLNTMKEKSQTAGIEIVCTNPGAVNSVTIRAPKASQYWLARLEDAGHVIQDGALVSKQPQMLPPNRRLDLLMMEPLSSLPETYSDSVHHFRNIPPAKPLVVYDKLKTKRFKDYYLYVVMTARCYDLYTKLRSHCKTMATSNSVGGFREEQINFGVGEVVVAPWNQRLYLRGCVTGIQNYCESEKVQIYFFDIGKSVIVDIEDVLPADEYCMKMERLSHVIWLENTTDSTNVLSRDYANLMSTRKDWTVVSGLTLVGERRDKYALSLSVEDFSGHLVLLTDCFNYLASWDWQKLYDLGFFTFEEIVKQTYPGNSYNFSSKDFQMAIESYLREMKAGFTTSVLIRSARIEYGNRTITFSVTPAMLKSDYRILFQQVREFNKKVGYAAPSPDSPTYPVVVMLRTLKPDDGAYDSRESDEVALAKLNCNWHRCIYRNQIKSFECVDCFSGFKVDIKSNLQNLYKQKQLDVREIHPELLKVAPLGYRLVVDIPPEVIDHREKILPALKKVALPNDYLDVVLKSSACTWNVEEERVSAIPVTIPKLTERFYDAMRRPQKNSSSETCMS